MRLAIITCSIVSQMCVESSLFVELLRLFLDFMLGFQGFVSHNSTIVSCVKKALICQIGGTDYNRRILANLLPSLVSENQEVCVLYPNIWLCHIYPVSTGPSSLFLQSNPKYFLVISKLHWFSEEIFHFYRCFSHIKHTKASC